MRSTLAQRIPHQLGHVLAFDGSLFGADAVFHHEVAEGAGDRDGVDLRLHRLFDTHLVDPAAPVFFQPDARSADWPKASPMALRSLALSAKAAPGITHFTDADERHRGTPNTRAATPFHEAGPPLIS